ncbi:fungal-specific transcription factor domain-containing protein [Xylariales sp. AK1849]|nr:fungal-specific transcription factor domain-containing protein [Xylariales sp. AK1849]
MERRSRKAGDANGTPSKSFVCSHHGCGKRFTRLEHQRRHEYNHGVGDATCPRCSAHFKRPDLLERHLNRHRQKDEEAGAEGYGVLNTRKRSWKAPDGTVVQKRPPPGQSTSQASGSQSSSQSPRNESLTQHAFIVGAPISPPTSTGNSDVGQHQDYHEEQYDPPNIPDGQDSWHISGSTSFEAEPHPSAQPDFWLDPMLLPAAAPPSSHQPEHPFDEIFQPDTASSFNQPFTTSLNYNWLFEQNDLLDFGSNQFAMGIEPGLGTDHVMEQAAQPMGFSLKQSTAEHSPSMATQMGGGSMTSGPSNSGTTPSNVCDPALLQRPHAGSHKSQQQARYNGFGKPQNQQWLPSVVPHGLPDSCELERPLSTIKSACNLPVINDDTRDRLIEVVDLAQPSVPSGDFNAWDHPLLSLSALQDYSDLFFTKFNTAYPLIHCATFDASLKEPLLLLSILLLGATYSTRDAHQLAVCIHDVLRPHIFAHAGFGATPELWVLQTILLVECFGKSRAGQKQHDMSHLFHGLLINLIRRSDCQSVQTGGGKEIPSEPSDLRLRWRQWAESEEKKRLSFLCFMWDTQHAVLFCQSLCMSAFELRLSMPCSQALWEARDEAAWKPLGVVELQSEISFLAALKSYLSAPNSQRTSRLNTLSRILLLHGLMSIAWDLQRRDQTALGVVSSGGGASWRNRLADAYDLWRTDFDAYCAEFAIEQRRRDQVPSESDVDLNAARREFSTFSTAYNAVYHAAHILLNSSFLDIQIYAGARHILGRPVRRCDYVRSERVVKRWAAGADEADTTPRNGSPRLIGDGTRGAHVSAAAAKASYHAACMLHEASSNLDDFDSMGLFHLPWCLYLSTLTLWAFHHSRPGRWAGNEDDESEMVWDARKEMDDLLTYMAAAKPWNLGVTQSRRSTGGLVWVMADVLGKVRWGIVHSGVLVLKALVPMRLINQYEAM